MAGVKDPDEFLERRPRGGAIAFKDEVLNTASDWLGYLGRRTMSKYLNERTSHAFADAVFGLAKLLRSTPVDVRTFLIW